MRYSQLCEDFEEEHFRLKSKQSCRGENKNSVLRNCKGLSVTGVQSERAE